MVSLSFRLILMKKSAPIRYAVLAIWVTIALSVVIAVIDRQTGAMSSGNFLGSLFIYAFVCILPFKISEGKNWARYVYAVVVALTTAVLFAGETQDASTLALIFSWFSLPLEAWVLYCLFRPGSGAWFGARSQLPD
jgi:hypothetical protein